ncbi:hypothetical protein [Dyadobacter sp. CY356]|uniref:hypothetical protein n=1 Tax=Dyadobacter sp. CY356 TaxID=2906442 RepID=UPI001F47A129|nr:hypothetical protein [Dyadobacter sp. CY356]MCF0055546.1 hypothetical protein [Dyadobacter sp. CY356]
MNRKVLIAMIIWAVLSSVMVVAAINMASSWFDGGKGIGKIQAQIEEGYEETKNERQ